MIRSCLLVLCSALVVGCASTKPAQVSALRADGQRASDAGHKAYEKRNWTTAAQSFQRAAEIYAALDDDEAAAEALHNRAQSLRQARQPDAAIATFEQALALNRRVGRKTAEAENLGGLAQCYRQQGKLDLAVQTATAALVLAAGTPAVVATIQNDLAMLLLERNQPSDQDRILELLNSALKTNDSLKARRAVATNHLNLGRALLQYRQLDSAEKHLLTALDEFRVLDDPAGLGFTHDALRSLYAVRNDSALARYHYERARQKFAFLKDEESLRRLDAAK